MLSERFKRLCSDAGLSIDATAKMLHVTPRTIRYWFAGKVAVPYAAYKLVRVLRWFELPGKQWAGWHMHSGKLWTPEGHGFTPHDQNWWSLLVRQARSATTLYRENRGLKLQLRGRGTAAVVAVDASASTETAAAAPGARALARDRREAPGSNLLIEHFTTQQGSPSKPDDVIMTSWPTLYDYPPSLMQMHDLDASDWESALTPYSVSPLMPIYDNQTKPHSLDKLPHKPPARPLKPRQTRLKVARPPKPSNPATRSTLPRSPKPNAGNSLPTKGKRASSQAGGTA